MPLLSKRRRRLISIGREGGKAPKVQRSVPVEEDVSPSDLEARESSGREEASNSLGSTGPEAREDQVSSEREEALYSLELMPAEGNGSPYEVREYQVSPEDGEEAYLYDSEEDTDDEWELDDDDSDSLSGSDEVRCLLYPTNFRFNNS
jgi:hypothetical protein